MSAPYEISEEDLVSIYKTNRKAFSGFLNNVKDFFQQDNDSLREEGRFSVHSVKYREKDFAHLEQKIHRKREQGRIINAENFFSQITDFCGVRVMHLLLSDFRIIHAAIMGHVEAQHWHLFEDPKAYTWDPEYKEFFEHCGLKTELKDSHYTSVHYVLKPNPDSLVTCEIQVRSLFDEIWGEIDHEINYPIETENVSCREQLRVLAKLVGAGTRLLESIDKTMKSSK